MKGRAHRLPDEARGVKRPQPQFLELSDAPVSTPADYPMPQGTVGLKGAVERIAPGTVPLRGDLAHIALAGHFLAAHYVVPMCRSIGTEAVTLKLQPRDDAEDGASFAAGASVELLDQAGDWAWVCSGPEGPSGYLRGAELAPDDSGA